MLGVKVIIKQGCGVRGKGDHQTGKCVRSKVTVKKVDMLE